MRCLSRLRQLARRTVSKPSLAVTNDPSTSESSDLQDLIGPIWRRRWLLLAIIAMATVGTYTASSRQANQYRSSTEVFVADSQIQSIISGGAAGGTDRSTADQAKVMLSGPVLERVIKSLHLSDTPKGLLSTITATPIAGSNFVAVTAERRSGTQAADVANTVVMQYIGYRSDQVNRETDVAVRRLRAQLASLPTRSSNDQQRRDLQDTIRQLQTTQAVAPSQTRQTDVAVASGAPFTPKPQRDALFAFLISIGLSLALAFGLERFDRRIKSIDEVSEAYGVPLLSTIPHTSKPIDATDGRAVVHDSLREPFRSLRTNLQLASLDRTVRRIAVISAGSGEGKSTIVRNLALTYREWGMSVAIVEADLRRPSLSASFGITTGGVGFTSLLTGESELEHALFVINAEKASLEYLDKVREAERRHSGAATTTEASKLVLLPSGVTPPNPQAVLATDKARQVLDALSERFDMVLIDTPPLLAVSDAVPLLPQCDGVIVVARVGVTDRRSAKQVVAAARLDPRVQILGVVANDLSFQPGYGYGYGYGYGGAYESDSDNGHKTKP